MAIRHARIVASAAFAAVLALGLLAAPAPVAAQTEDAQPLEFSEQDLQAYAAAAVEVSAVIRQWQPEIMDARNAGDEERVNQLTEEANAELLATIQDAEGISIEQYQQISMAARQDEALYNDLDQRVQALQQD